MFSANVSLRESAALTYQRVMETASRHPESVALDFGSTVTTYAQFSAEINAAALRLAQLRFPRQSRIGLVGDKRLPTYAWYVACWHQAQVVVPLSPHNPAAFNTEISKNAELSAVVVDSVLHPDLVRSLLDAGIAVINPTDLVAAVSVPPEQLSSDDLAYVMFTSGSTGRPKGVRVTHGNLAAFLDVVVPIGDLGPGARLSHTFALTFDPSVYDMFAAWTTGSTLVVPRNRELLGPASYVRDREITHWYSVPSLISYAIRSKTLLPESMPSLRQSLFVGEALRQQLAIEWSRAAPRSVIRNVYGPTELTVTCVEHVLPSDPQDWAISDQGGIPIGTPHPAMDWVLIDGEGLSKSSGELCMRGPQRFPGYLDASDNLNRFVRIVDDSVVPPEDCEKLSPDHYYRTGDRVRLVNGQMFYLGRLDRQVKVSGHRIELGEVEHKMTMHPGIVAAAAVAVPAKDGGLQLRAAATGTPYPFPEVRRYLLGVMPAYMVPADILWLDAFPLNGNGKVDYLSLSKVLEGDR